MSNTTTTIGKWMIWGSWFIFLALLTLFFDDQLAKLINPNQNVTQNDLNNGVKEVILKRNKAGHYVSSGFINEQPVVFLVDTGASDVAIPSIVADTLQLKKGHRMAYQTANGTAFGYRTKLNRIRIGNIELKNIRGGITPGLNINQNHILLGMTFLKHLEFTQRGNTLTLRQYPNDNG